MAIQVDSYVMQLAQMASQICGLDVNVILAQWQCEEGISSANWPSNNPAGITPGNPNVDKLATGVNAAGFLIFPTPAAGAQAYALLIKTDPNYAGIRAAIQTGNPIAEIQAIVASPWDSGHYMESGYNHLLTAYNEITGQHIQLVNNTNTSSYAFPTDSTSTSGIANQVTFPPTNYSVVANSQRTGNVLYGRRYRVIVANSGGIALDVSDLHCTFDIQYVVNQQPPFSTIVIYNLNPVTEDFILNYGDRVIVEAGYEGNQYGVIFDGEVVEPIRDKEDNVTYRLTINALAGNSLLNQSFVNFTLNRGQSARSIVQNLASMATHPSPIGELSPQLSAAQLPRAKAVFGLTRDYIRQIAQASNLAFYTKSGEINLIHASDPPKGEILDLTPESGLIGQPTQQDLGVSFRCLLNPAIQIGTMVHIDSSLIQAQTYQIGQVPRPLDAQGIYRVVGVEHVGDTRGNDWYTNCVTVSQAGGIPNMIASSAYGPW